MTVLRVVRAFVARDARVAVSYRLPFLLEVVSAVFAVLTVRFVGEVVDPSLVPGGYLSFVALGLVVATFVDAGLEALGGNLRQEQIQGTLEAMFASGLSPVSIAVGMSAFPMLSAVVTAVLYLVVAFGAGASFPGGGAGPTLAALVALVVGAVAFSGLGLLGAAIVLVVQRGAGAIGWLVAVLSLGAGELFPPEVLPDWVQAVAKVSPFTWCLDIVRRTAIEGQSWGQVSGALGVLALLAVASVAVGVAGLDLALRWARKRGTLGAY